MPLSRNLKLSLSLLAVAAIALIVVAVRSGGGDSEPPSGIGESPAVGGKQPKQSGQKAKQRSRTSPSGAQGSKRAGATANDGGAIVLAEWLKRGRQACSRSLSRIVREGQGFAADVGGDPTPRELEQLAEEIIVPGYARMAEALAKIPKPDTRAADVRRMLDLFQRGIAVLRDDPILALDPETMPTEIHRMARISRDLGVGTCLD